ncbi:MAG: sigma-70 family RNA polymerase sigma factor [Bacteroidales bacterium]|nr:sigma-70 family RNA polymerase sigma factor [Bacteroidales bacterium]MBN2818380.1 sigma-70 family RNA polymerase sigma factor [Bacteroidales bacterium]
MFIKFNSYNRKSGQKLNKLSDEELIRLFKTESNRQILGEMFDRYVHLVFASCMKYLKNEDEAQDATMMIFESLEEKLGKHEVDYFKSWLYTLTKNHCLMLLRKKKPVISEQNFEKFQDLLMENDNFTHPDSEESEKKYSVLLNFVNDLKDEQKLCIEMMYLNGKTYKDIAVETGFELKHVKSFIQNGKRNLKIMLDHYYEAQNRTY